MTLAFATFILYVCLSVCHSSISTICQSCSQIFIKF